MAVLISSTELERLERTSHMAQQLALALGQDAELSKQVEAGEIHPAMAAFGLWRDEAELARLADEIYDVPLVTHNRCHFERVPGLVTPLRSGTGWSEWGEDIQAALAYAADVIGQDILVPLPA